jgi:hypothetical protein
MTQQPSCTFCYQLIAIKRARQNERFCNRRILSFAAKPHSSRRAWRAFLNRGRALAEPFYRRNAERDEN